ncbi:acyl transferase [Segetibacter sp.]|uniref:LuxE/PaaK family acyltransferase n=1 Tax=Segetibacter sp. TaxID=2231182 RepID=UPI002622B6E3|nr:acyl transferase [Segetibacter sp.]MCW3081834.1 acyl transferase [Segetibacter sp.]
MKDIVNNILSVSQDTFGAHALDIFQFQYQQNIVYKNWVDALRIDIKKVTEFAHIPFLPVSFFKTHKVVTGPIEPELVFESSGTTRTANSRHFVKEPKLYTESFTEGFRKFYGDPKDWCIIGLLPSFLERKGSSLIMMVEELIRISGHNKSGFYLYEFEKLASVLQDLEDRKQKTLLIGVTFALLDFADQFPIKLKYTTVMETGGMKGRRKEMVREEVHAILQQRLGVPTVHSEYGMTELLSQGYSFGEGIFNTVPWMKVLVRDEDDPLLITGKGRGLINVIDLANIYSCSFIATDDVGRIFEDGSFEVVGRRDNSDIRGCSLMVM